jgi:hypothetical protein
MRGPAILCALALALVVVLVLFRRLIAPAASAAGVPTETHPIVDGPRASQALEADPPLASPSGSEERDAVAPAAAQGPTCRIRVVDAASRAPLPGARVWIQRADVEPESLAWWSAMQRYNDVELALRGGLGDEVALDGRAEAFVPRPARKRMVAAAYGEMHGETTLVGGADECIVELTPYHALAIEVVDRADDPIPGALVALYWGEPDPLENISTWAADADGFVRFPKLEAQAGLRGYRGPVHACLAAGVPGEPEAVQFTIDAVPADPIRLVAGDFGRIVLQLVDSRGEELALDGKAHLALEAEELDGPSIAVQAGAYVVTATVSSGRAVFDTVGLGLSFFVAITADGQEPVPRHGVAGPTEAGEELLALVTVGKPLARARGRVHGIRACFGETSIPWTFVTGRSLGPGVAFSDEVEVEGDRFDRPFYRTTEFAELGGPWILELSASGKPTARALVRPSLDERASVVDFGDVRFEPVPELARVRVRDDSGAVAPYAGVEIHSSGGESQQVCDGEGLSLVGGSLAQLPMVVRATHEARLPSDWARIEAPGSEIELVVRRGASVLGRLWPPAGTSRDDFEVWLRVEPDAPGSQAHVATAVYVDEERFRLAPCASGRGTLTVSYLDGQAVYVRPGLELAPGQELELEPIDLSGVLHPFALTFELASGEPWQGGHLAVREADGELSTWTTIGDSARATFFSLRPSVDLWVTARGARAMFLESVLDGDRLTLSPAPSLRLRLSAGIRLPDPPLALQVRGAIDSDEEFDAYYDLDTEAAAVAEDGSALLRVARPGRYELEWFVHHTGTGADFEVKRAQAQTVEVTESAVPVVEAELGREEVERAVREAGG